MYQKGAFSITHTACPRRNLCGYPWLYPGENPPPALAGNDAAATVPPRHRSVQARPKRLWSEDLQARQRLLITGNAWTMRLTATTARPSTIA